MDTGFIDTAIPDLSGVSLEELTAELTVNGCGVLARAVAEYRRRLEQDGVPLSSFNAGIGVCTRVRDSSAGRTETVTVSSRVL